jgi:ribonuclease HII
MKSNRLLQFKHSSGLVAGCDEAGRGCLAGPVFAAAVIIPDVVSSELANALNDSKLLNPKMRTYLRSLVEDQSVAYAVAMVDHHEIDKINILQASIKAMHLALDKLNPPPGCIIVDGNRFIPYKFIPYKCIVKGDGKYLAIAAASILAKTCRDEYMLYQHLNHPQYGWDKNKGYPTVAHRDAIVKYGLSPIHRKTFRINKRISLSV